jgi:hypothetical protein
MKGFLCIAGLALAAINAWGQQTPVTADLGVAQEQTLPNEDLRVAVKITNISGRTLQFGKEADWLTFKVESLDGFAVPSHGQPPVTGEFSLDSSTAGTKRVNITPHFNIQRPGRYRVIATVKLPQWGSEVSTPPKTFEVLTGTKLKVIDFGVPSSASSTNAPEMRKYILQQANYSKELKLYVRVTDATETETLKVLSLARIFSFSRPELQLDRFSNLHVVVQTAQKGFSYFEINPEGQLLARQTHDFKGDSRPHLVPTDDGLITVTGGVRREADDDLPPSK